MGTDIQNATNPAQALILQRFFKTGPGEYGEGDLFLGIKVPILRSLVKKHSPNIRLADIKKLLRSPYHKKDCSPCCLWLPDSRRTITDRNYLISIWPIPGISTTGTLSIRRPVHRRCLSQDGNRAPLYALARSKELWESRIAIVATLHFIRQAESATALDLAAILLHDTHDLIHKAVGWMLRETGKP